MRDDLSFIKTIKVVLLFGAIIAFGITYYQLRGSFKKDGKEVMI